MASNGDLIQHRIILNNGSGEIPALGFRTSLSDNKQAQKCRQGRGRRGVYWDRSLVRG